MRFKLRLAPDQCPSPQPDQMSHTSPGSGLFFPLAQREGAEFLISQILRLSDAWKLFQVAPLGRSTAGSPNLTAPPDKVQGDLGIAMGFSNSRI